MAQRHAAESSNTSADVEGSSSGGGGGSNGTIGDSVGSGSVAGGGVGNGGGVGDVNDMSEAGEATMLRNSMKRTPTPVPSPAPAYPVPNMYSGSHYYESLPKRLMR